MNKHPNKILVSNFNPKNLRIYLLYHISLGKNCRIRLFNRFSPLSDVSIARAFLIFLSPYLNVLNIFLFCDSTPFVKMRTTIIMLIASKTWYNHSNDSGIYGSEDMSRTANKIPKTVVATPSTMKVTVMV